MKGRSLSRSKRESLRLPVPAPREVGSSCPGAIPSVHPKDAAVLEAGENLSHAGRFALAAFLHRVGASPERDRRSIPGGARFRRGDSRVTRSSRSRSGTEGAGDRASRLPKAEDRRAMLSGRRLHGSARRRPGAESYVLR